MHLCRYREEFVCLCTLPWSRGGYHCESLSCLLFGSYDGTNLSSVCLLQLLARADNVKDFIRRGETEGSVDILLSSGGSRTPIRVYRRIRTDENSGGLSEWKLNGDCMVKPQC